jgi:hypothetical protein
MIEVDIDGHPPIPLAQKMFSHLGSFCIVFRVPNFQGYFDALNDIFLAFEGVGHMPILRRKSILGA